ncbi:MAG TPA: hypothetical protein P5330_01375 [Candidatus Competibacteraceae bacterium]|nr:hypothetical protein [Candidatus Competibacteraceae bacterium]
MPYNEFTLESVENELGVMIHSGNLFADLSPIPVPAWLQDLLIRGMQLALISEKARSEFIVAPILLACRELSGNTLAILSGQRLDVDPERKLQGECDFIMALSEPLPRLRAPLMTIVEAKRNDIESGLGQCIAQMVGAQLYNERAGQTLDAIYGCVTTGEDWQFLQLRETTVIIARQRLYIDNVGRILAVFQTIFEQSRPMPT